MVYGCQCLGFLTCAQMLIDAIVRGGCPDTVGEFALKLTGRKFIPAPGTPTSVYFRHRVVERLEVSWKTSFALRQTEWSMLFFSCMNLCHAQRVKGLANFGFILLVCYKCIIITAKTQRLLLRLCVAYLFALLSFLYASFHSIFTCIISLFWSNKASLDRHVDALLLALLYASFHSIFTCASFLLSCIHS